MKGRTSAEAAERLKQCGPIRVQPAAQRAVLWQFLASFKNPLVLVLFTLLVNVVLHRSLLESFLFAVALAVGLTPELLPISLFSANEALFRTGWFVESIATQVLVIFVIGTRRNPLRSHPTQWLVLTSLGVVLSAMILPFSPLAPYLGFTALPLSFFGVLMPLLVSYLFAVEGGSNGFTDA